VLVLLGVIGLPAVLAFAWVFEMTPEGIKRESEIQHDDSVTAHTAKKLDKLTIVLLIAVVVIVIADRFVPQAGHEPVAVEPPNQTAQPIEPEQPVVTIPSVAVLPFANMSSDPDNEYFSDGISEELLNLLVQVDGLRVPSRTSSFAFKGMNMDIKEIARKLAVEHVLEGSVRKAGNQVRITAQLIDVSTDTHIWSNTYDRELKNIFAIQDEISREIIHELKIALDTSGLVSRDESRPTDDMQAYQDYLRGRHLFIQRGVSGLKASIEALQAAVSKDPEFTDAWAALSQTAATLTGWDQEQAEKYNTIALDAGNRALSLDQNSATALSGLGLLNYNKGNWSQSLELLKRASKLSKDSTPTYFYGLILVATGYLVEGHENLVKAEQLDPVYPQLQYALGISAMFRDDLTSAQLHFQHAIDGANTNGVACMYWLAVRTGNLDEAISHLEEIRVITDSENARKISSQSTQAIIAAIKNQAYLEDGIKAATAEGDIATLGHFGAYAEIMTVLDTGYSEGKLLEVGLALGNNLWAAEFSTLRQMPGFKKLLFDIGMVELWKTRGWPDLCQPTGDRDFECE
jgi:TolB-like protein